MGPPDVNLFQLEGCNGIGPGLNSFEGLNGFEYVVEIRTLFLDCVVCEKK